MPFRRCRRRAAGRRPAHLEETQMGTVVATGSGSTVEKEGVEMIEVEKERVKRETVDVEKEEDPFWS